MSSEFGMLKSRNQLGEIVVLMLFVGIATAGITAQVYNVGNQTLFNQGWEQGYNDGYADGFLNGTDIGYEDGYNDSIEDHSKISGYISPTIDGSVTLSDNWTASPEYNLPFSIITSDYASGKEYISMGEDAENIYTLVDFAGVNENENADNGLQMITFGYAPIGSDPFGVSEEYMLSDSSTEILTLYKLPLEEEWTNFNLTVEEFTSSYGDFFGSMYPTYQFDVYNDTVNWADLVIGVDDITDWNSTYKYITDEPTMEGGAGIFMYYGVYDGYFEDENVSRICVDIDLAEAFPQFPSDPVLLDNMLQHSEIAINMSMVIWDAWTMEDGPSYFLNETDEVLSYLEYTDGIVHCADPIPMMGGSMEYLMGIYGGDFGQLLPNLAFDLPSQVIDNGHLCFNISSYSDNATVQIINALEYLQVSLLTYDWQTYLSLNSTVTDYDFVAGNDETINNGIAHLVMELRVGKGNFAFMIDQDELCFYLGGLGTFEAYGWDAHLNFYSWVAFGYMYEFVIDFELPDLVFTIHRGMPELQLAYAIIDLGKVRHYME